MKKIILSALLASTVAATAFAQGADQNANVFDLLASGTLDQVSFVAGNAAAEPSKLLKRLGANKVAQSTTDSNAYTVSAGRKGDPVSVLCTKTAAVPAVAATATPATPASLLCKLAS